MGLSQMSNKNGTFINSGYKAISGTENFQEIGYEIRQVEDVNVTLVNYQPTDLRLDKYYSLFYVHLVRSGNNVFNSLYSEGSRSWLQTRAKWDKALESPL